MKLRFFYYLFFLNGTLQLFPMDKQSVVDRAMRSKKETTLSTLQEINDIVAFFEPNLNHPCRESWLNRCLKAHPVALKIALAKPSELTRAEIQSASKYIKSNPTYPEGKLLLAQLARADSDRIMLEHEENEKRFSFLLQSELIMPDPTRWEKIHPLLASIGSFLSVDKPLREELFNCVCDIIDEDTETVHEQNISYETWVSILGKYRKEQVEIPQQEHGDAVETDSDIVNTQVAQELEAQDQADEENGDQEEEADDASFVSNEPVRPKKEPSKAVSKKSTAHKTSKVKNKKTKKKNIHGGKKQAKKKKQELENQNAQIKDNFCRAILEQDEQRAKELATKHPFIVDIDMREEALNHKTPLQWAVLLEDLEMCRTLLKLGAKPTKTCGLDWKTQYLEEIPTLGIAVLFGQVAIAKLLLQKGAAPNQIVYGNRSKGDKEHVLCFAASAQSSNNDAYTPEIQEEMIRLLLLAGAKAPCKQLQTIDIARKKSWPLPFSTTITACMPTILKNTSKIVCIEDTIVLLADSSCLSGICKSEYADPQNLTDKYIQALLSKAIDDNDENKAKLVIEGITDPRTLTTTTEDSIGMLQQCVINHQAELCSLLLSHRADPNAVVTIHLEEDDGTNFTPLDVTPLMLGIVHTVPDVVELLLKHKADPNCYILQKSGEGEYPLCVAVEACQSSENERVIMSKKIIADLIKAGATKFEGSIILYNPMMGTVNDLDLEDKDDYELVVTLLDLHDVNTLLECKKGVLIFNISVDLAPGEDDNESN